MDITRKLEKNKGIMPSKLTIDTEKNTGFMPSKLIGPPS